MLRNLTLLLALISPMSAIAEVPRQCFPPGLALPSGWTEPYEAHRVIGNLYAIGTADLGVFLIATNEGHILINTGLEDSAYWIKANIEALEFEFQDIKILLTTQAHFDHTAALAEIKLLTGAQMLATPRDAPVLLDGGASDAQFGHCLDFRFPPVTVDGELTDGEEIKLGDTSLKTHHHPGHTAGSASYSMIVREDGRDYRVLVANMGTINQGKRLSGNPTYRGVARDFALTFNRQRDMRVDIWVASHGSQYGLARKYRPGQAYSAKTFYDPQGFKTEVRRLEQLYREQLAFEGAAEP
ncbi:MAG TPA: subclass B3 metallo-beta-lactamase [Gammaproteobacteria bacterium]|nr:subclass B3 metallo-beta-lactamase [Gammaproteobacteria bacterium]